MKPVVFLQDTSQNYCLIYDQAYSIRCTKTTQLMKQIPWNSLNSMKPEGSILHLRQPTTVPYPEPNWSRPCPPPFHFSKIHFNIILLSTPGSSKWTSKIITQNKISKNGHLKRFCCTREQISFKSASLVCYSLHRHWSQVLCCVQCCRLKLKVMKCRGAVSTAWFSVTSRMFLAYHRHVYLLQRHVNTFYIKSAISKFRFRCKIDRYMHTETST